MPAVSSVAATSAQSKLKTYNFGHISTVWVLKVEPLVTNLESGRFEARLFLDACLHCLGWWKRLLLALMACLGFHLATLNHPTI